MGYPRVVDTYLKVEDMDRAVGFYEAFLGVKAEYRYEDRWVSITDRLGLYNPSFDAPSSSRLLFHCLGPCEQYTGISNSRKQHIINATGFK